MTSTYDDYAGIAAAMRALAAEEAPKQNPIAEMGFVILDGESIPLAEFCEMQGFLCLYKSVSLRGYDHELPVGLTSIGGSVILKGYNHPLPAGLTSIGGDVFLYGYDHALPAGLTRIGGSVDLGGYGHELPAGLTWIGGSVFLCGYNHALPAELTRVGGSVYLGGYNHPFSDSLTSIDGNVNLGGYYHPLPAGMKRIGGYVDFLGYDLPLPSCIVRGSKDNRGYLFFAVYNGTEWRIYAGCRRFSVSEALSHWGENARPDNKQSIEVVRSLVAEIEHRGPIQNS